jgi:hypothetical protein
MIVLGYSLHGWIDSTLIARMAESMTSSQAANLGGLLAGAVALTVGVVIGWIAADGASRRQPRLTLPILAPIDGRCFAVLRAWFNRYPASRGLVLVAMVSIAGVALGVWLFLGRLIMVLAVSLGYYGRSITLRTAER